MYFYMRSKLFLLPFALISLATEQPTRATYFGLNYHYLMNLDAQDSLATTSEGLGGIKWGFLWLWRFHIGKFFIGTGPGINFQGVRFKNPTYLDKKEDYLLVSWDTISTRKYQKSKLQGTYVQIPLMLGIELRRFAFSIGGYFEYLITSKLKHKYEEKMQDVNGQERTHLIRYIGRGQKHTFLGTYKYGVVARLEWLFRKDYTKVEPSALGVVVAYDMVPWLDAENYKTVAMLRLGVSWRFTTVGRKKGGEKED